MLKELLVRRFISKDEWPPKSPDLNPLDYHFWDSIVKLVYENRTTQPFENFAQLNRHIKAVYMEQSNQHVPHQEINHPVQGQTEESCCKDAGPITQHFG